MAVRINPYDQRLTPQGAGLGGSSGRAAVPGVPTNDAVATNLLATSVAGGSLAASMRERDDRAAVLDAHVRLSQAALDLQGVREQMERDTPDDPTGFTPRFSSEFQSYRDKLIGETNNPAARAYMTQAVAELARTQIGHALSWESAQTVRYRGDQVDKITDNYSRVLAKDPDSYRVVIDGVRSAIDNMGLTPEHRLTFRDRAVTRLTEAAAQGFAEQNPRLTQKLVNERLGIPEPEAPAPKASAPAPSAPQSSSNDFLDRIVQAESRGRDFGSDGAALTSPKGAKYQMQVMPATAAAPGYGIKPAASDTPAEYNRVGREYLAAMTREFGGDEAKAAAAYNAGPGAVKKAIANKGDAWLTAMPAETRAYVATVTAGRSVPTPMQFASAAAETMVDIPPAAPVGPDIKVDVTKSIGVPFLDALDAKQLFTLKTHTDALVRQDQAVAQSQLRAAMHTAGAQAERGVVPDAPSMALVQRAVGVEKAPEVYGQFETLQRFATAAGSLQSQTLPQMAAIAARLQPTGKDDPEWEAKTKQSEAIASASKSIVKERSDDWINAAGQQGIANVQPIDWSNPQAGASQLAARQAVAQMRGQYVEGVKDAGALTKREAAQVAEQWQNTPPESRLGMLKTLRSGLTDDRTFMATVQQFLPDRPESIIAAGVYMRGTSAKIPHTFSADTVLEPAVVARTIERGADLLNPTRAAAKADGKGVKFPMPSDQALYDAMPSSLRDAYATDPEGYQLAQHGIRAYYAAAAADRGHYDAKEVNSQALDEAVTAVTGGTTTWRGQGAFLRPWGMDASRATMLANNAYDAAMAARGWNGGPADQAERYRMVPYKDGQYVLSYGGSLLRDAAGPVVIDLLRDGRGAPAAKGAIQ